MLTNRGRPRPTGSVNGCPGSTAGWLALLVGCLEYDLGQRQAAEATRRSALSLGQEAGSSGILGWAHEMRAWFALTSGDYRGVIAAADGGEAAAGSHSVSPACRPEGQGACAHGTRRRDAKNP